MSINIADLRKEYAAQSLLETDVAPNPITQFSTWWQQALDSDIDEANAMTLATASCDGLPSARIVLLKGFNSNGFVFFTNYKSYKSIQLEENPKACLLFFWKELERQVRIVGLVKKVTAEENDSYYNSRPKYSRLGAIVSQQSQVIESRQWIDEQFLTLLEKYKNEEPARPDYWGGYIVKPIIIVDGIDALDTRPNTAIFDLFDYKDHSFNLKGSVTDFKEAVRFAAMDNNNVVWIAHTYKGVFRINTEGKSGAVVKLYTDKNGLPASISNRLFKVKNRIAIATEKGIYEYNEKKDAFESSAWFKPFFGERNIRYLREDAAGNIWFIENKMPGVVDFSESKPKTIYFPELNGRIPSSFEHINPAFLKDQWISSREQANE